MDEMHAWAFAWLRNNPHVLDCPTDKALGTAISSCELYGELIFKQFSIACIEMSADRVYALVDKYKARAHALLHELELRHALHKRKLEFCRCFLHSNKLPHARQLIKVHKKQTDSRLIVFGTTYFTNPVAVLVAHILQPALSQVSPIACDSADVLRAADHLHKSRDSQQLRGCSIYSVDVEHLYPSICQNRATESCKYVLTRLYSEHPISQWGIVVDSVVELIQCIFASQVTTYKPKSYHSGSMYFLQVKGITTGLSRACQIANSFLLSLDLEIARVLSSSLWLYKRFIDDVLVIGQGSSLSKLLGLFNQWCPGVKITNDDEAGKFTSFLDLLFVNNDGHFNYSTFRKPMNKYAYLPYSSNHALGTKLGIVSTECVRLLITNETDVQYARQQEFFLARLVDRGYPEYQVRKVFERYDWNERESILRKRIKPKVQVVPFKLQYAPGLASLGFARIVAKHKQLLPECVETRFRFVMCYTSANNIFMKRYSRFISGCAQNTGLGNAFC